MLADEINRAPAKTQAALLEAMQERQTTADGVAHPCPSPFLVIATQNPIESEGTYPLPEAQLDRFILRTTIGLPEREDEVEIVRRRLGRGTDEVALDAVLDEGQFRAGPGVDRAGRGRRGDHRLRRRPHPCHPGGTRSWPSGRARVARSPWSSWPGPGPSSPDGDFVTPDDVKDVALPALAHRVVLTPEAWARRVDPVAVVDQADPPGAGPVVALIRPAATAGPSATPRSAIGFVVLALLRGQPLDLVVAAPFAAVSCSACAMSARSTSRVRCTSSRRRRSRATRSTERSS